MLFPGRFRKWNREERAMAADNEVAKNGRSRRDIHHFTKKSLETFLPRDKPYIVRDDEVPGLVVKVFPSGRKTFFLDVLVRSDTTCSSWGSGRI